MCIRDSADALLGELEERLFPVFAAGQKIGAVSPTLSGLLFAAGWISAPLVACGAIKIAYDLTLWRACRGDVLEDPGLR